MRWSNVFVFVFFFCQGESHGRVGRTYSSPLSGGLGCGLSTWADGKPPSGGLVRSEGLSSHTDVPPATPHAHRGDDHSYRPAVISTPGRGHRPSLCLDAVASVDKLRPEVRRRAIPSVLPSSCHRLPFFFGAFTDVNLCSLSSTV